jgi:hypothetical protein
MPIPDRCATCNRAVAWGRYEASFRLPSGRIRNLVDLPGCVCPSCSVLYLDPRLIELAGLTGARCLMAIESETGSSIRIAMRPGATV